jgi:hypothetical protein
MTHGNINLPRFGADTWSVFMLEKSGKSKEMKACSAVLVKQRETDVLLLNILFGKRDCAGF